MQYLTVQEVAKRLNLSKDLPVLRAIQRGELRAVNVGTGYHRPTWRISEDELQAWIERRTSKPPAEKVSRRRPQVEKVTKYF